MIATDEEALICDFAEYYHIYDYRALHARQAATLACGLREKSRIRHSILNTSYSVTDILLMSIADRLGILIWQNSEDGYKGINRPDLLIENLAQTEQKTEKGFEDAEKFENVRQSFFRRKEE